MVTDTTTRKRIIALLKLDSRRSLASIARAAQVSTDEAVTHLQAIRRDYRFTIAPFERKSLHSVIEDITHNHAPPVDPAATAESRPPLNERG